MFYRFHHLTMLALALLILQQVSSQKPAEEKKQGYVFTVEKRLPATPVEDQHRSGTCWSFATVSFLESELLRTGKGAYDLSEMFYVRKAYELKAEKYVRMHGKINFAAGGLAMDVLHILEHYGALPEQAYDGLTIGDSLPVHGEMDAVLKGYVDQVIRNRNGKLTPVWKEGFNGILDAYLGIVPSTFQYGGDNYDPGSFARDLGLDPSAYVAVGSYTHHPFYSSFIIEIPDNWMWGSIENVPLDDMMDVLDHALEAGYTVCWDADVGEQGFDWKKGVALIPSEETGDLSGLERARWDELSEEERQALGYDFSSPRKEKEITQDERQRGFDNYRTTDDHLMHVTGTARDQFGNRWYLVKNSWGVGDHVHGGYIYVSRSYMRAKTLFFMVHKKGLPPSVADKLGF